MRIISILIIITYKSAFAQKACDNPKEPMKILKHKDLKKYDEIQQFINNEVKYLCPVENRNHYENLRKTPDQYHYELRYCLFGKTFEENDEIECLKDVNPIFIVDPDKDNKPKQCGTNSQHLYKFGYYYCGDDDVLEKFENKEVQQNPASLGDFIQNLRIYDVCFDNEDKKTMWTRHTIQHPGIFLPSVDGRENYCPESIRTDPFFMEPDTFEKVKQKYEEEKNKKKLIKSHKIVPQYLVPLQHLALRMWKKTANHYINTAPLRQKLAPLMTAIDEGIKRAGKKIYSRDKSVKLNDLIIFTKVEAQTSVKTFFKKLFRMQISESNIWYKVVYSFTTKNVLTIIIHDTTDKWKKQCSKRSEVKCNFKEWTEDKKVKELITRDNLKHAYCCQFRANEINDIFSFNLSPTGLLDIDSILAEK